MEELFSAVPIRESYKVAHPESIVLLSRPSVIRRCVVFEAIVVILVFFFSYYYSATTGTELTKISFQVLQGYSCTVLTPRSDTEVFDEDSVEYAAFSSARYTYQECMTALDSTGFHVCSDEHRKDYFVSVKTIETNDNLCEDLVLTNNYRLCTSTESSVAVSTDPSVSIFDDADDTAYTDLMSGATTYFSNQAGIYHTISLKYDQTDLSDEFLTDYVSDFLGNVYFAASHGTSARLFKISPGMSSPELLMNLANANELHGLACDKDGVYVYYIEDPTNQGRIFKYNTTTAQSTSALSVDCNSYEIPRDVGSDYARLLSVGSDGYLYATCTEQITEQNGNSLELMVARVDPHSLVVEQTFLASFDTVAADHSLALFREVGQVLQVGHDGDLYFLLLLPSRYIVKGNILHSVSSGGNDGRRSLQNLTLSETYPGEYGVRLNDRLVYFTDSSRTVFDTLTEDLVAYTEQSYPNVVWATRALLGYAYQVCGVNATSYTVDSSLSTSFSKQCQQTGGVYYQIGGFHSVPAACQTYAQTIAELSNLTMCADMDTLQQSFVQDTCTASFSKICDALYTNNPPFSCEKTVYPGWLSVLATALANASAAWGFTFFVIKLFLRSVHPHFVRDFDYDATRERYLDKSRVKICPKESPAVSTQPVGAWTSTLFKRTHVQAMEEAH